MTQRAGHWKTLLRKGAGPKCVGLELGDWDQGVPASLYRFDTLVSARIWACKEARKQRALDPLAKHVIKI